MFVGPRAWAEAEEVFEPAEHAARCGRVSRAQPSRAPGNGVATVSRALARAQGWVFGAPEQIVDAGRDGRASD